MTVTASGQITIPEKLRERFALLPGTEVEFIAEADALRIKAIPAVGSASISSDTDSAAVWLAKAAGSARHRGLTTDQLMVITRGDD